MLMGLFDRLKRILRLQSIDNQSIHPSEQPEPFEYHEDIALQTQQPSPIAIERDSLQLGIAAGYTGRSIKDIDSSLARIESQMVTKDWLAIKLEEALKAHESREELRFNKIENSIAPLLRLIHGIPAGVEPIKQLVEGIRLTRKMNELIRIVQEAKEISYVDLATRLGIQPDNLRGLLSKVARRTNKIQRFEKDNSGWVRWISDFNRQSIDERPDTPKQNPENTQPTP